MLELYREGKIDRLFVAGNRFVNTMTQKPTVLQMLPAETLDADELQETLGLHLRARGGPAHLRLHDPLHRGAGLSRR